MMKINVEERMERGREWFKKGYNCSQAVVAAFADVYGIDPNLGLRMAASFGGGMGRMRLTCGAVSGMFILAGLENGSVTVDRQMATNLPGVFAAGDVREKEIRQLTTAAADGTTAALLAEKYIESL